MVKVFAGVHLKVFPAEQLFAVRQWRELYYFAFVGTADNDVYMGIITRHHIPLFGFSLFYFFIRSFVIPLLFQLAVVNKVATGEVLVFTVLSVKVTGIYIHRIPDVLLKPCLVVFNVIHFIGTGSHDQAVEPCFTLYNAGAVVIYAFQNVTAQYMVFVMTEEELLFKAFVLILFTQ